MSVQDFNRYLEQIHQLDESVGLDENFEKLTKLLRSLFADVEDIIERGEEPLTPALYQIKIYYPISQGELPLQAVQYNTNRAITPSDLLNTISAVYNQPLTESNIRAYIELDPKYQDLRDPIYQISFMGGPKLRDVVGGNILKGLQPYADGYTVMIED